MFTDYNKRIHSKYVWTSYGIALVWVCAIVIPVLLAEYQKNSVESELDALYFVIFSGVIFPLARIPYDLLIGFRLHDKQQKARLPLMDACLFAIYLLVLLLSLFLAPFGVIYVIVRFFQRDRKN